MTRILVVESETRARQALKSILESAGYEVVIADGGSDAGRRHAGLPADLIVSDGLYDGLPPGVPVLAVPGGLATARGAVADQLRRKGAAHVLPKPFHREALLDAVRDSLAVADALPASLAGEAGVRATIS